MAKGSHADWTCPVAYITPIHASPNAPENGVGLNP